MYHVPRHPAYIYSLLKKPRESPLLLITSVLFHELGFTVLWGTFFLFEIIAIGFPNSVAKCLEILTLRNQAELQFEAKIKELTICLQFYDKFHSLVQKFNELFADLLFVVKAMFMILLCILVYIPLRISHLLTVPMVAYSIFAFISYVLIRRISLILTSMGKVYEGSKAFKTTWSSGFPRPDPNEKHRISPALARQNDRNKERLIFLSRIRFRCGDFYHIQPRTILTFFSITTTYIIVLLQL